MRWMRWERPGLKYEVAHLGQKEIRKAIRHVGEELKVRWMRRERPGMKSAGSLG